MVASPLLVCPRCGVLAVRHRGRVLTDVKGRQRPCPLTVSQVFAVAGAADACDVFGFKIGQSVLGGGDA